MCLCLDRTRDHQSDGDRSQVCLRGVRGTRGRVDSVNRHEPQTETRTPQLIRNKEWRVVLEGLAPVYVAGKKTVTGSGGRRLSDRSDTGSVPTCRPDRRSAARPRRCSNTGTHRDSPGPRPGLCHIPGRGCTRRRSSSSTPPLPRGLCGSAGGLAEPLRQGAGRSGGAEPDRGAHADWTDLSMKQEIMAEGPRCKRRKQANPRRKNGKTRTLSHTHKVPQQSPANSGSPRPASLPGTREVPVPVRRSPGLKDF
ncbi:zinc finger E-box-binding homeobox 2-like isoform X1 [Lates japonicus]|uniref:Zinc finger E-box-binding homeobox 2-like isoform X1 n=1 Tax=Lates japonicus TaxID=270547 RepID=A0AAD3NQT4_LATJO|nr:zinc finger E-box-binding homeobox 2-like isoform X1 [Lates japonicus]